MCIHFGNLQSQTGNVHSLKHLPVPFAVLSVSEMWPDVKQLRRQKSGPISFLTPPPAFLDFNKNVTFPPESLFFEAPSKDGGEQLLALTFSPFSAQHDFFYSWFSI